MKISHNRKPLGVAVACAMAMGVAAGSAFAQAPAAYIPQEQRSLVVNADGQVWRSGYGGCWHSGTGPAPLPGSECGPSLPPVAQSVPAPIPLAAAPIAPAPAPMPAVIAAAPPAPAPVVSRFSLDADALFDFDKAVLRPEGRTTLDGFVANLNGVDYQKITATGHTDRFGSNAYNQTLSEKRAEAVKTYLVAKGIGSERVLAEGKGEIDPLTKAGDCLGPKSAKVVACLQQDRRVDIELVGTKTTQR